MLSLVLALAPQVSVDEHRAWLAAEAEARGLPGLSAAVVRAGAIEFELGVGLESVEQSRPTGAGTRYPLYSVSKMFAAVAVLQQVEDGKLDLDAPVSKVLTDLPPELGDVTLRQALAHTSGLRNWMDAEEWKGLAPERRAELRRRDVLEIVAGMPRAFPAGERFAYSQTGFVIAGGVLEAATRSTYDVWLRERLFDRNGIGASFGGVPLPVVYERVDGKLQGKDVRFEPFVHPAAGLNASVHDLANFAVALQAGKLLRPESWAELWRETKPGGKPSGYGLGWVVDALDGHRRVGHEGGGAAWFWHFPDDRLSIAVLTNQNGARADALVDDFARRFLGAAPPTR